MGFLLFSFRNTFTDRNSNVYIRTNMKQHNQYDAPSDRVFNDLKRNAIKIWKTYDNTYGYVDEKLAIVKKVTNYRDNYLVLINMFDPINQNKLMTMVKPETASLIVYARGY